MKLFRRFAHASLVFCFGIGLTALPALSLMQQPPELGELNAAMRIVDPADRAKELLRIKEAYPASSVTGRIDAAIATAQIQTVSQNTSDLTSLLAEQNKIIESYNPKLLQDRFLLLATVTDELLRHKNVNEFPKTELLSAVKNYSAMAMKLLEDPKITEDVPEQHHGELRLMLQGQFELHLVKAFLLINDGKAALDTLEKYSKAGRLNGYYYNLVAEARLNQKQEKEAMDAYISASFERDGEALGKAKAIYARLNKNEAGFDNMVEQRQSQLPFHPEPFSPPAAWKGKAVLAELFTGSECPPCIGADFGFDGLIETYPTKYLAVLQYHLPIPRPDPMMNPATKLRQDFYEIRSTPTVVIDGNKLSPGGGGRSAAKQLFESYKSEIDPLLDATPTVKISVRATLTGDDMLVACSMESDGQAYEYNVVLVQTVEKYKGGNGMIFHKMVVRDIVTKTASDLLEVKFNIAESVKATDAYLTNFENTSERFKDFKFPMRHHKIDKNKLQVVVFAQDANTKQVYNSVVADVEIVK